MTEQCKKAIIRRRIFMVIVSVVLVALEVAMIAAIVAITKNGLVTQDDVASDASSVTDQQSSPESSDNTPTTSISTSSDQSSTQDEPKEPEVFVTPTGVALNADYSRLILVNGENPLPEDYNYGWNLTTMESEYHNGQLTQIDAGVWPYMKAMVEAAWQDGVKLYVWSPYRSYETQNMLFQNQVNRVGGDEDKAATVVARPGTSEHNTGLCADFNMARDAFEDTKMYTWMCENAADYGFILRYPKNKTDITGVIYESWHWRFVGINAAKEINAMGVTLEEYVEAKGLNPMAGLYENATAEPVEAPTAE